MNIVKEAVLSLKKNKFTSGTTIGILALNILILGIFAMLILNLDNFLNEIGNSVEMSVYLKEGTKKEYAEALALTLKLKPGADEAQFVSRDVALKDFAKNEDFKIYLESFKINPLPDSIQLVINKEFKKDPVKMKEFADSLKKIENVSEVYYQKEEMESFFSFAGIIRKIVLWLSVILFLGSILMVSSAVRLSVFARKEDIRNMKSAGTSLFIIKSIFIVESMLQGAAGGLLAGLLLFGVERMALDKLNILWSGKWLSVNPLIAVIIVGSGIVLGLISSLLFRIKNYIGK